jgi:hypothetical protein
VVGKAVKAVARAVEPIPRTQEGDLDGQASLPLYRNSASHGWSKESSAPSTLDARSITFARPAARSILRIGVINGTQPRRRW